jgi:hypothetical protein
MLSMRYSLDAEIAALLHSPRGNWFCAYRALARNDSPLPRACSNERALCFVHGVIPRQLNDRKHLLLTKLLRRRLTC